MYVNDRRLRMSGFGQDYPVDPSSYNVPLGPPAPSAPSFWDELSAAAGKIVQAGGTAAAGAIYKSSGTRPPNTQPVQVAAKPKLLGMDMNTVLLVGGVGLVALLFLGKRGRR